ncbi:hypothetical protein [uncultured Roseobacter sp.]|uniref:hypothetical protein n=1 Tax=uncultured Roseobacter sp. TaxID=114847 RepID=UPI0026233064|nr:hypothetical protein [uncultured Roseobacter sp.]
MDRDFFAILVVPGNTKTGAGERSEISTDIVPEPIKNRMPPPDRLIKLRVATATMSGVFDEPFSEVVGLIFRGDSVAPDDRISADFIQSILMAAKKLVMNSPLSKKDGAMIGVFLNGRDYSACYEVYSALALMLENQPGIGGFDVFGNHESLKVFLKRLHFRSASLEQLIALEGQST